MNSAFETPIRVAYSLMKFAISRCASPPRQSHAVHFHRGNDIPLILEIIVSGIPGVTHEKKSRHDPTREKLRGSAFGASERNNPCGRMTVSVIANTTTGSVQVGTRWQNGEWDNPTGTR